MGMLGKQHVDDPIRGYQRTKSNCQAENQEEERHDGLPRRTLSSCMLSPSPFHKLNIVMAISLSHNPQCFDSPRRRWMTDCRIMRLSTETLHSCRSPAPPRIIIFKFNLFPSNICTKRRRTGKKGKRKADVEMVFLVGCAKIFAFPIETRRLRRWMDQDEPWQLEVSHELNSHFSSSVWLLYWRAVGRLSNSPDWWCSGRGIVRWDSPESSSNHVTQPPKQP